MQEVNPFQPLDQLLFLQYYYGVSYLWLLFLLNTQKSIMKQANDFIFSLFVSACLLSLRVLMT